jgi:predicted Zn-dependent protease
VNLPRGNAALLLAVALVAGAGGAEEIVPFAGPVDAASLDAKERMLWDLGADADTVIRKSGVLLGDDALDAYLQGIVARLFPEFPGAIRARTIRSSSANAFMQPNGSTYVFNGMLNFADSEAQIAAILAHEGVHFIDRHGYRGYRSASAKAAFGNVLGLGLPFAGQMVAHSSIMGFSRALEHTADEDGFERLMRAGYDVREAKRPFERLVEYLKALDIDEPWFFADHPQLADRVEYFERAEKRQDPAGGEVGREDYLRITAPARLKAMEDLARKRDGKTLLYLLGDEQRLALLPPEARFYHGLALRQRGRAGDLEAAIAAFERTVAEAPGFAPAHKALGDALRRDPEQRERARAHYQRFLELAPDSTERDYVLASLARLAPADPQGETR